MPPTTKTPKPRPTRKPPPQPQPPAPPLTPPKPDGVLCALLTEAVQDLVPLGSWHDAHTAQTTADGILASTVSKLADRLVELGGLRPEERALLAHVIEQHYRVVERVIA